MSFVYIYIYRARIGPNQWNCRQNFGLRFFSFVPREHLGRAKAVCPTFLQIVNDYVPHLCDQCTNDKMKYSCLCQNDTPCVEIPDYPLCPKLGCFIAKKNNHKLCFQSACKLGFTWDRNLYALLSHQGDLEGLKRIHREDGASPQWDAWACAYATTLPVLVWLRQNGCPITKLALTMASAYGHIHIVEWLLKNESKDIRTKSTCEWAAKNDHLDVLQLLRKHGCPWSRFVVVAARKEGNARIVDWIEANVIYEELSSPGYLSWSALNIMDL